MNPKCPKCNHDDSRKFTNSLSMSLTIYICPKCSYLWEVWKGGKMKKYKGKWIDYEGVPMPCTDKEWEENEKRLLIQIKGTKGKESGNK